MGYAGAAHCILGNHDMHLLAVSHGSRPASHDDTLSCVLDAPDRDAMLHWLSLQPLARLLELSGATLLMVHAGVLPQWSTSQTMALAQEVHEMLQSPQAHGFFLSMYSNFPLRWDERLAGNARWRTIVNALTRLRFCTAEGEMEFETKEGAKAGPPGFMPWFEVPGRATESISLAFGHWSRLGLLDRTGLYCLDTGCVWGGCLSALRIEASGGALHHELIQVKCQAMQQPGL
jgi:bis(5'-nucleosyl)-tetraphosphatase (symmetrical)